MYEGSGGRSSPDTPRDDGGIAYCNPKMQIARKVSTLRAICVRDACSLEEL